MSRERNAFCKRTVFVVLAWTALIGCGSAAEAVGIGQAEPSPAEERPMKKRIILLGASIGRAWDIASLPQRMNVHDYIFEYADGGSFDKSAKLREILSSPGPKPEAIFLKECAAYFPGDLSLYKSLMESWIRECRESKIIPIPTTAVPVTRLHSFKKVLIDAVKRRNPFGYGNPFKHRRNAAILEYNDWIRAYCRSNGLALLDLEAALRYGERNRYLRENLSRLDGLHVNRKAYRILDRAVISALEKLNWEKPR